MTTFSYTTGNPANLTGGANAAMIDIQGPLNDVRTFINSAAFDSTNIAAGPTLISTQQAWISITPVGAGVTWSAVDVQYMKDSLGFVHVRGRATASALPTAGSTFLTLPAGFRPVARAAFVTGGVVSASDWARMIVAVDPAGTMFFESVFTGTGGSQIVVFDVVTFKAV